MATVVKTVKLPRETAAALARVAKATGCSESELIRRGIEVVTKGEDGIDMMKLSGPGIGIGRGPGDLSTNRKYRVGYGRSRSR